MNERCDMPSYCVNKAQMCPISNFHPPFIKNQDPETLPIQDEENTRWEAASVNLTPSLAICDCSHDSADYLQKIITSKVYDIVDTTPLTKASGLSDELGCNVLLKREDLQPVFSYRLRGVYNKMANVNVTDRWKGVITSSVDDALAVAYSANKLRVPSMIVLPLQTPDDTVQQLTRLRSTVILHGANMDAAREECSRLQLLHEMTYISTCEDPYSIGGYGTIGMEIINQAVLSRLKAVFCPIDCGTLIAGLGIYLKRIAPNIKIIGVEVHRANDLSRLLRYRGQSALEEHLSSRNISPEVGRVYAEVIDDIVQVDMNEVFVAIKDIYKETRHLLESTGAISVAGLKSWVISNGLVGSEMHFIAITSEANVDFFDIPNIVKQAGLAEQSLTHEEVVGTELGAQISGLASTYASHQWSDSPTVVESATTSSSISEIDQRATFEW